MRADVRARFSISTFHERFRPDALICRWSRVRPAEVRTALGVRHLRRATPTPSDDP